MKLPASDRQKHLPLTEAQLELEKAVDRLTGRIRNCARNAFVHIRKAWDLHGVDDAMSAFRAITAEEEAATALLLALKRQRYPGSGLLKPWNHVDKNAFWPVITAVNNVMFESGMHAPSLLLSKTGRPSVSLHIDMMKMAGVDGEPVWAEVDQPLNFSIRSGHASKAVVTLFEAELAALASTSGEKSILAHIKTAANLRNRLLYADDGGIPDIKFEDAFLVERARRVCVLTMITIMVTQTPMHQLFVLQCLKSMLQALALAKDELLGMEDFEISSGLPILNIHRNGDLPAKVSITRRAAVAVSWGGLRPAWKWQAPQRLIVTYRQSRD